MKTAQARIASMEEALKAQMRAEGMPAAHVAIHVLATSRGWVVYVDSVRMSEYFDALDAALEAAEAYVRRIVSATDNLARTLGIAS